MSNANISLLLQDIRLDIELDIVPVVFFEVNDGTKSNPDETFWMVPETDWWTDFPPKQMKMCTLEFQMDDKFWIKKIP